MKEYAPEAIRNVVIASHSGSGKTSLTEACLFLCGATDRLGNTNDGNTVSDYLPEELKRKSSVWTAPLSFERGSIKINLLDTPGYVDFFGEVCTAMTAAENAVFVVNAANGVEYGLEMAVERAQENNLACFVFVNQLDRERTNFDHIYDALHDKLHLPAAALTYPLGREGNLRGFIDVVTRKAYEDKNGKLTEVPLPEENRARIDQLRQSLIETAVECDDALMEKYLEGAEITDDELQTLFQKAEQQHCMVPVLCGSAAKGIGIGYLLDAIEKMALSPASAPPRPATDARGEAITVTADPKAPFAGFVFKTFSDAHTGRMTFIKIMQGTLQRDADVINLNRGQHEKLGHLYTPLGKKHSEVNTMCAGDIALVVKLKGTGTGDTLSATPDGPRFAMPSLPGSLFVQAISAVSHNDDDKMHEALTRLREEDPTLKIEHHPETAQTLIAGLGDIHLTTAVSRLKSSYGVEVTTEEPKVPYRETIRKPVKYEGKLKKQSGGHGQYADVWLEIEPSEPDAGFEFVDKIVGGVVPRSFIPAVEEGVREAMREGPLAGYPLVDLKVTLYDGKYHDVDSSYQTFKMAGSLGLRGGTKEASPVLLEPIMETVIEVPEDSAGDVVGDLNSRRGQILGMEPDGTGTVRVKACIPDAELMRYPITLRSLTHGRGRFTKRLDHYNHVPENVARPLVEEYQKRREAH